MKYETRQTEAGKWQAVIVNPSLGWEKIYTYETEEEALLRVQVEKQETAWLTMGIKTISEYFGV